MDLATFHQALILCGIVQVLRCNSTITQGYNGMEVFACYLVNHREVSDFVKSVNKLPVTQDNKQPLIPFALIRLLQAMHHWMFEHQ